METITETFLERNREKLKDFASSQIFFSWADLAMKEGMDIEKVFYNVLRFNIKGE